MPYIRKDFDSIGDLVREACDESIKIRANLVATSHDTGRDDFFWTSNFDEAVTLATNGWSDGAARVVARRDGLEPWLAAAKAAKVRQHSYDVTGDYVDVGRHLSGEAECFGVEIDSEGGNTFGRVVSIRLNQAVSGSVDPEAIAARGVVVLLAVDLLESCGIRCEVILSKGSISSNYSGSVRNLQVDSNVVVKRAGDPVDLDRLAFWIAHPASFRRFGFRINEQNGLSPCGCRPTRLADYGQVNGVIEVDEVCTASGLRDRDLIKNVLAIASACGLEFDADEVAAAAVEGGLR